MSGSEGGLGKPTSRKAGRAPWSDPYTVAPEQMSAAKVVATYKSLARVERDFRSLKAIDVDLRPIHH